jgi:acetolactate synthase I/II/III large subunit
VTSVDSQPARTVTLTNVSVAELLLRYLAMEGATTLFGIPGAAMMEVAYQIRVQSDSFRYIICRHETGAAYAADGYARVTGGLGVVLVTSGPGATNALTGTVNADNCGTPLLTISGEVAEMWFGMAYLQEGIDSGLDVDQVYRASCHFSAVIDNPMNFCTLFEQALRDARGVPGHAVHVTIPVDVSKLSLASVNVPAAPVNYRPSPPGGCDPSTAAQIVDALLGAQHPLIMLGNGARAAMRGARQAPFAAFVAQYAIPVMTTPGAKGIFPEAHDLSLRNYGLAGSRWATSYLVGYPNPDPFDALLVIGSDLGELATTVTVGATTMYDKELLPAGPFIHVDADSAVIGRAFPVDTGVVAEAGATIDALLTAAQGQPVPASAAARQALIAEIKQKVAPAPPPAGNPTPGTVDPIALMQALNLGLPAGTQIFFDCGNCVGWSLAYLEVNPPSELHSALSMGPMGFAVGAVVGAKLALPGSPCVAICGDGAFVMHAGEVATASQYGLGAIWVVLADSDLAMVSQGMATFYPGMNWSDYYVSGAPDLVGLGKSLGANAVLVDDAANLNSAVAAALSGSASAPQVIVVKVDPAAIPPYYVPTTS